RGLEAVADLQRKGALVVMTSQCLWGRVNLNVYSTGRDLLDRGVVPGEDMLPEVALVKVMWCLGQSKTAAEAAQRFRTLVANEFDPTTPFEVP
ncbi:MAG: Glu-tRNA(Gln) amidotransferase GatDE subunit D, partial [Euryarchaeota archaeon]|nr:Glu-tRNA(Gln) amidotransferase GatDE subunit D [Euryarchaeota archaeon]